MSELKDALEFIKENCSDAACKLVADKALEQIDQYDFEGEEQTEDVERSAVAALTETSIQGLKSVLATVNQMQLDFEELDLSNMHGEVEIKEIHEKAGAVFNFLDDFDYDDLYGNCESLLDEVEAEMDDHDIEY